jgi:hypothetical protein
MMATIEPKTMPIVAIPTTLPMIAPSLTPAPWTGG